MIQKLKQAKMKQQSAKSAIPVPQVEIVRSVKQTTQIQTPQSNQINEIKQVEVQNNVPANLPSNFFDTKPEELENNSPGLDEQIQSETNTDNSNNIQYEEEKIETPKLSNRELFKLLEEQEEEEFKKSIKNQENTENNKGTQSELPEGFFDNQPTKNQKDVE